jgi:hypothetical protein
VSRWCLALIAGLGLACGKTVRDRQSPDGSRSATPDASTCTATVRQSAELASALSTLEAPALICVEPARYDGPFVLQDGIDLAGIGPGAIVVGLDAERATERGVTLSNVGITTLWAGRHAQPVAPIRLRIRESTLNQVHTHTAGPGRLEIAIDRSVVEDQVISIEHDFQGSKADVQISLQSSRCDVCYPMIHVMLENSALLALPTGSRIDVDVSNNLVVGADLHSLFGEMTAILEPLDLAASRFWFRHNTIVGESPNHGIFAGGSQIVVANNVVVVDGGYALEGNGVTFQNAIGSVRDGAEDWFENDAAGNYTPSATSPLVGAAGLEYATSVDYLDIQRDGSPDVGAFERTESDR